MYLLSFCSRSMQQLIQLTRLLDFTAFWKNNANSTLSKSLTRTIRRVFCNRFVSAIKDFNNCPCCNCLNPNTLPSRTGDDQNATSWIGSSFHWPRKVQWNSSHYCHLRRCLSLCNLLNKMNDSDLISCWL